MINRPRQDLRYHIRVVNRINNSLQYFFFTRVRELNRITQTTTEMKFELIEKFAGINLHPNPTSTQIEQ